MPHQGCINMDNIIITEHIKTYCLTLPADEKAAGTVQKYRRNLTTFGEDSTEKVCVLSGAVT